MDIQKAIKILEIFGNEKDQKTINDLKLILAVSSAATNKKSIEKLLISQMISKVSHEQSIKDIYDKILNSDEKKLRELLNSKP